MRSEKAGGVLALWIRPRRTSRFDIHCVVLMIADVIIKTTQWMSNLDVRLGLIHNAKTPPAFSLRILPTLPDAEVRSIARGGTNMALKTAALRQLQGR